MEDPQPDQTQEQSRPEETAAQEQPTHDLLQASPEPGQQEGATLGSQRGLPEQKDLGSSQNLNQQNELVPQVDENGNPIMQEEKKEIIPEEILEDMKNIYEVFDEEGKNQVEIHELRTILRALDIDPSEDELDFLSKLVDPEQNGYFSYQQLKLVMEEKLKETDTMEDLLEELKKLDRDQDGRIPNPQFKQFMMNLGSKMTLEQVEELMAEADPKGEGAIDIEDLATRLCPPKKLRSFDFYKDLPKELSEPSMSGASMSMFAVILLGALFISQLAQFLSYQKTSEIVIDASSGMEKVPSYPLHIKLNINIDITLGKCPCHILSLDIVDVTGVHVVDVQGKVNKIRLDKNGNQLGQKDMIQEIQQSNQHNHETILKLLKQGLEDQEGCRIQGTVVINKVPGNFHISTHAFGHVVQLFYQGGGKLDFSHHIHHLSFGDDGMNKELQDRFGETFTYDLDGIKVDQANFIMFGQILANYYLEVNEMEYEDKSMGWSKKITGFKHKASRSILAQLGLPALFFKYELSPIKLKYTITNKSVIEFFVNISAIIGGVFTVASILESLVRNTLSMVSPHDKKT